jgi:hypothetical protein
MAYLQIVDARDRFQIWKVAVNGQPTKGGPSDWGYKMKYLNLRNRHFSPSQELDVLMECKHSSHCSHKFTTVPYGSKIHFNIVL